jgi:hypothetical protein
MPDHDATPLTPLPAGQRELEVFPRFGLGKFARFYVSDTQPTTFEIRGDVARNFVFDMQSSPLPGVTDQISDRFPWPYPSFMDHPRARVAFEERGNGMPSWLLRPIYRLLIPSTIRRFRRALERHRATAQKSARP